MRLLDRIDRQLVHDSLPRIAPRARAAMALAIGLQLITAAGAKAQRVGPTPPAASAPDPSWVHESWTVKDGLPVNSINAVIQDRTGYIWAATFDGLVRFDGVRFTVFNTANSDDLPSDRIIALSEGRDGSLWLATEQLELVRFRAGRFTKLAFEQGRPRERVATLLVDSAGTVWVGTTQGLWAVRGDRLVPVARETVEGHVWSMTQRRDGTLWVGTMGAGIFRVTSDGRATKLAVDPALQADSISRIYEDADGVLWLAGRQALWSWRERPVRVRSPGPPFEVTSLAQEPATGAMVVAIEAGVRRVYNVLAIPTMGTGATALSFTRAKGIQCFGIGPAIDMEDGPRGFGAHSD